MKKDEDDKFFTRVGRRIQKVRCEKNLTREDVAKNTNISVKFLYEIESGVKGFNANILYKIAKELNVSCDYLLGYCSIGKICQEQCMDRYKKRKDSSLAARLAFIIVNAKSICVNYTYGSSIFEFFCRSSENS